MKIGDLIKFEPVETDLVINDMKDDRRIGTVVGFEVYRSQKAGNMLGEEPIVAVLWSTGVTGWILQRRIKVISESR